MKNKLSLKEQKILWSVLNQAQYIGVRGLATDLRDYKDEDNAKSLISDWINQTQQEYDIINSLKAKLCGDLE